MQLFSIYINNVKYALDLNKGYIITYQISDNILTDISCQVACVEKDCLVLKNDKKIAIALIEKIIEL